jgi:hypothetical protein
MDSNACLKDLRKIWDRAPHNAMTDLTRYRNSWVCVFREGTDHISPDGRIRILISDDGSDWNSVAALTIPELDLRDPKISETPSGTLMINAAAAYPASAPQRHQSFVWFSSDGNAWEGPYKIGDRNNWLWRVTWKGKKAYGIGYNTVEPLGIRLYAGSDGRDYDVLVDGLFVRDSPNEAAIAFRKDETALCLLRRDAGEATAQLGIARPPYKDWTWKDLGVRIGGPHIISLPDGRIVAAVRRYGETPWTSINWVDEADGKLTEFLALPSGGDTSYAGLCWHDNLLWASYYSSHEQRASIYLAKIKLPQQTGSNAIS